MKSLPFTRHLTTDLVPRIEYRVHTPSGEKLFYLPEQRSHVATAPVTFHERATDDTPAGISGTGIVFDSDSGDMGAYGLRIVERIDRGAVRRALAEHPDIVVSYNHDLSRVLGRTSAGTARVWTTPKGVHYHATPPQSEYARDAERSIKRGDVRGSSFMFIPARERIDQRSDGTLVVTVLDIERIAEMGPTSLPAYAATDAYSRTLAEAELREQKVNDHRELVAGARREFIEAGKVA